MLALLLALSLANPSVLSVQVEDPKSVWVDALIDCESSGSTTVKVLDTDGFYSYGLGQFHMKTWLDFGKEFGTTKENIYDGKLQKKVIRSMLDDGWQNQWYNCSKRVQKQLGPYPSS